MVCEFASQKLAERGGLDPQRLSPSIGLANRARSPRVVHSIRSAEVSIPRAFACIPVFKTGWRAVAVHSMSPFTEGVPLASVFPGCQRIPHFSATMRKSPSERALSEWATPCDVCSPAGYVSGAGLFIRSWCRSALCLNVVLSRSLPTRWDSLTAHRRQARTRATLPV